MKQTWRTPRAFIKDTLDEVLSTDGSARMVATSFAIGTGIALLPTFGFGIFAALLLLVAVPSLHKPGLLMAFMVWNPLVQIPLYSLSIAIGSLLFSGMPVVAFDVVFLDHAYNLTRRVLVGNLIVTSILSLISYCFIFITIRKLKGRPILMRNK